MNGWVFGYMATHESGLFLPLLLLALLLLHIVARACVQSLRVRVPAEAAVIFGQRRGSGAVHSECVYFCAALKIREKKIGSI